MTPRTSPLLTPGGVVVEPRGIFHINFPARLPNVDPPQRPYIGPHVGVVLAVRAPRVAMIYCQSKPGKNRYHLVQPGTAAAKPFEPWITGPSHFRADSLAHVVVHYLGDRIGTCLLGTFTELGMVADAGMAQKFPFVDLTVVNPTGN